MTQLTQSVQKYRISDLDRIEINGTYYSRPSMSDEGYSFAREDTPNLVEHFTHIQIDLLQKIGSFRLERDYFAAEVVGQRQNLPFQDLLNMQIPDRNHIVYWVDRLDAFLAAEERGDYNRSDASIKAFNDQYLLDSLETSKKHPDGEGGRRSGKERKVIDAPSPRTFRKYLNRYQQSGYDPLALQRKTVRSGNRTKRLHPNIRELLTKAAAGYADSRRPTKKKQHKVLTDDVDFLNRERAAVGLEPLPYPSRNALSKEIDQLGSWHIHAGRYGIDAAKKRFKIVGQGFDYERAGECLETDENTMPLMAFVEQLEHYIQVCPKLKKELKAKRYTLCGTKCATSRAILGLSIADTARKENVRNCLHMSVLDKASLALAAGCTSDWPMRCTGEKYSFDGGSSMIAGAIKQIVWDLKSRLSYGAAAQPALRAGIENFWHVQNVQLAGEFSGRTFGGPEDKGDYDPVKNTVLTLDELWAAIIRWVVDVYHHTPCGGLNGETPYNAWHRLSEKFGVLLPPSKEAVRTIFGRHLFRKPNEYGLVAFGVTYQSELIQQLRRQDENCKIELSLDPFDLGQISVRDGNDWYSVPARKDGFDGIALWDWCDQIASLKERFGKEFELTAHHTRGALDDIANLQAGALKRARLPATMIADEDLDKAEAQLMAGVRLHQEEFEPVHLAEDQNPLRAAGQFFDPAAAQASIAQKPTEDKQRGKVPAKPRMNSKFED